MLKIAICDDETTYLHDLRRLLLEYAASREAGEFAIHLFSHPFALTEEVEKGRQFDLFLLDIYMPGMTGIVLAQELRKKGIDTPVIFLTTSKDHALAAYGVGAIQYLLKPFKQESFFSAMDTAMEKVRRDRRRQVVFKLEGGLQSVPVREIRYTEARRNYQEVYLSDGSSLKVRMTTSELYEQLAAFSCFARCGIAYILNLAQTKRIEAKNAILSGDISIPIPRNAYSELKRRYFDFYSREDE